MTDLRTLLAKRGIADIADLLGWESYNWWHKTGWRYPVYHLHGDWMSFKIHHRNIIGYRWKAAPEQSGAKYAWIPDKPDNDYGNWYLLPSIKQYVNDAQGTIYIVNGEPALLSMFAGGIWNAATTTLSEVSVPHRTLEILEKEIGVKRLIYIADRDHAGMVTSAKKWRDTFIDSAIEFLPVELPEVLGDKADINDLWMHLDFDIDKFQEVVQALPALILPKNEPVRYENRTQDLETPESIAQAIAAHYGLIGTRINPNNGFYVKPVQCPLPQHIDRNPSAGVHSEKGILHCHVCGSIGHRYHADLLGIDTSHYWHKKRNQPKPVPDGHRELSVTERDQYRSEAEDIRSRIQTVMISDPVPYSKDHPTLIQHQTLGELIKRIICDERVTTHDYTLIEKGRDYLDTLTDTLYPDRDKSILLENDNAH